MSTCIWAQGLPEAFSPAPPLGFDGIPKDAIALRLEGCSAYMHSFKAGSDLQANNISE